MELIGTQTRQNLENALNAEARANVLYRLYADQARKEGDYTAGQLFDKTAHNELAHAALWYEILHGGNPGTRENLRAAIDSERFEAQHMYSQYAEAARAEGFDNIANLFDWVAATERTHENAYAGRLGELENGREYSRPGSVDWICQNCGHHQPGTAAPEYCPVCRHGQGYFLTPQK